MALVMNWCAESKASKPAGWVFMLFPFATASWDLSQVTETVDVKLHLQFVSNKMCVTVQRLSGLASPLHKKSHLLSLVYKSFSALV